MHFANYVQTRINHKFAKFVKTLVGAVLAAVLLDISVARLTATVCGESELLNAKV